MSLKIQNFEDSEGHAIQVRCKRDLVDICAFCPECKENKQYINLNIKNSYKN